METAANSGPSQLDQLTSAQDWCAAYRQRGLPVSVAGTDPVLHAAGKITAVRMPVQLGERVQHWLRQYMVAGPVFSQSASEAEQWTFLASANVVPRKETQAELREAGVEIIGEAAPLPLPLSVTRSGRKSWWVRVPEGGRELPALSAVICAARVNLRTAAGTEAAA